MFNAQANMHIQGPQINQFNNVMAQPIPRSSFRRDFTRRTTFDVDWLVPCFVDEILPGDDVSLNMSALARLSTPIKPLMDNLYLETFFFFVPNRLVWENWEKFQGQRTNPSDSVTYSIPKIDPTAAPLNTTGMGIGSLWDYYGLPTLTSGVDDVSALYFRAYHLIYNEWFRDENLQNAATISKGDGPDLPNAIATNLRKRNKRKDYITSCLPWPQKGDAVSLPIGGMAPVITNNLQPSINDGGTNRLLLQGQNASGLNNAIIGTAIGSTTSGPMKWGNQSGLQTDLSSATPVTINALRQAALYQQILELDARAGTRYVESIYSRFGVISPDFRLQRPELIGQGSTRVNVYAVPQTNGSGTASTTPQGNLAGFGTAQITGGHGCRYAATEHGMIIGLVNVRADLTYQNGVPRMFTRKTRLDFYEPLLNGLGEQAVLRREVDATGTITDKDAFGYQERFSEYRFKQSEVTGFFRSNAPTPLDIWHLSQDLVNPVLSDAFIQMATPIDRVLAAPTEPDFLCDMFFTYNHVRPMPIRSNPGIDRL